MKAYCRQCVKKIEVKEEEALWEVALNGVVLARAVCPDCGNPTGTSTVSQDEAPHDIRVVSQEVKRAVLHHHREWGKRRDAAIILLIRALGDNPPKGGRHSRAKAPEVHEALSEDGGGPGASPVPTARCGPPWTGWPQNGVLSAPLGPGALGRRHERCDRIAGVCSHEAPGMGRHWSRADGGQREA